MKKIRYILISIITILIVIIVAIIINRNIKISEEIKKQEVYDYFHTDSGKKELIQKVCEKNGNWKYYPLSSKFLSKYNEKDGYFGDIQFDEVKVNEYANSEYFFSIYDHIGMTQGKKKTAYIYAPKYGDLTGNDPGLDDILIGYIVQITDEKGIKQDVRLPFRNIEYKEENIYNLARGNAYESGVAVTDHFHSKYPFFLDLFIHYSPLSYNEIKFIEKESDLENNIAIFEVDSILECKKRKYKVKLILDDKLYLDDCEVELLEEMAYEGNNRYITPKLIYKHSNWENLEITDNFRKNYNFERGVIEDIDNLNIDYEMESQTILINKEYVNTFINKENGKASYRFEFLDDKNGYIDDIKITKID